MDDKTTKEIERDDTDRLAGNRFEFGEFNEEGGELGEEDFIEAVSSQ